MLAEGNENNVRGQVLESILLTKHLFQSANPFIPALPENLDGYRKNLKAKELARSKESISRIAFTKQDDPSKTSTLLIEDENITKETTTQLVTSSAKINSNQLPTGGSSQLSLKRYEDKVPVPQWHSPWELCAVISGHIGWVRSIAFDPSNEWFATGSADRTIKIWDLAKCCAGAEGGLKLTLTGHISAVRGLAVSSRHPYMFSAGEDKMIKCWDLEYNKVIRHYHGHLSGVYCLELHPTLDILMSGGRDSVTRVWDMRTKHQIHTLSGHSNTVSAILTNSVDPQVITSSHDATIKMWDLVAGKTMTTLTHHKKAVRGMCANPKEMSFISCGADNIKKWQRRDGRFLKNFSGHNAVLNCVAMNEDGVVVSCADNGSMQFWDNETGYCFQKTNTIAQSGSLDAEAGIYAATFDKSGSRFLTCEADKSIKIWKENEDATEVTHPIDMPSWTRQCLQLKRH